MADDRPLVSVIIAVKNGERFLQQALEDVAAQTYDNHETVVVDGRSTDRSAEIATSFPGVRCVEQPGEGFADAWNIGIDAARGELIAFLDSDDRWVPEKLAAQVGLLRIDPRVAYSITRMRFFLEHGQAPPPGFRPELLQGDHIANMPSALLARSSVFDEIGRFAIDYEIASDIDWFARLKDSGLAGAVVSEVMVLKRVHDANVSYFAPHNRNGELLRLLRHSVARQRP
jgi:glycosyltransferase involved in cell wall biosynthesis